MSDKKSEHDNEDNDLNNQQDHDPVEAGKKAIEAEKLANDPDKPKEQQEKEDKDDAEKWRNEG